MSNLNNENGSIVSSCNNCGSAKSTFEWNEGGKQFGFIRKKKTFDFTDNSQIEYRLFRCAGCGSGGLGVVLLSPNQSYPEGIKRLLSFLPNSLESKKIPHSVPTGIKNEFREAEKCFANGCYRAASGLFRSVLDKVMRANGYKTSRKSLAHQIDDAADDGVITKSRKIKAHSEIRVLGNDVLHDDWVELSPEDVLLCWHYTQRILEDFYDDRESVLELLRSAHRKPDEDNSNENEQEL